MNYFFLASGVISLSAVIGHFVMGSPLYLKPVMQSGLEMVPKRVMQSLFHYMSVIMILTTITLLAFAFGETLVFAGSRDVALFIGVVYGGYALVQIAVSFAAKTMALFQWVFWALISVLTIIGA